MSDEIVKSVWNTKLTLKEIIEWHIEDAEMSETTMSMIEVGMIV